MSVERSKAHDSGAAATPILKIGHVANIVGVSSARIRLWEHERLITPMRTESGQRQYSMQDVKRLEKIRKLLESKSMTMIGVRNALDAEPAVVDDASASQEKATMIGQRVKALRMKQRMSLRDLSSEIDISPSALSAFERGISKPSIGRISQIAHALGATVPDLLGVAQTKQQMTVRRQEREVLPLEVKGVKIENLYLSSTVLQSQMVTVDPGCGSGEPMTHAGEDFLTVFEGGIVIVLDSIEEVHLEVGDSMTFSSARPHSYHNRGKTIAKVVWVNTPPTF